MLSTPNPARCTGVGPGGGRRRVPLRRLEGVPGRAGLIFDAEIVNRETRRAAWADYGACGHTPCGDGASRTICNRCLGAFREADEAAPGWSHPWHHGGFARRPLGRGGAEVISRRFGAFWRAHQATLSWIGDASAPHGGEGLFAGGAVQGQESDLVTHQPARLGSWRAVICLT